MLAKVKLSEKFARFDKPWSPKIVAELNDAYVKVVKLEGEFVWHHHDDEDELFWVVSGRLRMELRDGEVILEPGELLVVPRGVEHRPVAEGETHVVLIEPKTTLNTGNVRDERTVPTMQRSRETAHPNQCHHHPRDRALHTFPSLQPHWRRHCVG